MSARINTQRGLSLIELLVAMAIGAVLIFGATQVYVNSRTAYGVNENIARLQETARYAMAVIEPDVRMSNFWGLLKGAGAIAQQALQTQPAAAVAPGGPANICGTNFAVDVSTNLQGDNNGYVLRGSKTAGFDALTDINTGAVWNTNTAATADPVTVRHPSIFKRSDTAGLLTLFTAW